MQRILVAMGAATLLTACGGDPQPGNSAVGNSDAGNAADATNYQAEVIALPLAARQGVFLRAIRDAKFQCQNVTESEKLDPREGNPTWRATCDGRTPHIISITKDGTANIVSRSDAR